MEYVGESLLVLPLGRPLETGHLFGAGLDTERVKRHPTVPGAASVPTKQRWPPVEQKSKHAATAALPQILAPRKWVAVSEAVNAGHLPINKFSILLHPGLSNSVLPSRPSFALLNLLLPPKSA